MIFNTMRAFIAIKTPKFEDLTKQVDVKGVKVVNEFHITMKFLGEISDDKVSEIKKAIESIKFEPYEMTTTNVGVYPNENYMRTIWLGTKDGGETEKIQAELEDKLAEIGFKKEKRKFESHITLGRVKFVDDKEALKQKIKSLKADEVKFKVDKLFLIKSELTKEGPIYEEL
jgi:2'-5' RNA ligase